MSEVHQDGAAYQDGRLKKGDVILAVRNPLLQYLNVRIQNRIRDEYLSGRDDCGLTPLAKVQRINKWSFLKH